MPLLSLTCSCGHCWDALKTFSTADPTVDACPKCGKAEPTRVYASAAIHAKGYDYENAHPLEKEMALKQKAEVEADPVAYLDGRKHYVQPKGIPPEYAPTVPDYLSKKYY